MKGRHTFTDDVILIKPFRLEDAETHLRGEDIEIRKWLNEGHTSTIDSVKNWIQSWDDDGSVFPFAIWTIEDETLVGMIEARTDAATIDGIEHGDANISYCLYSDYRRKGYMPRAINLIQEFLIDKGIKRIVIRISPDNINSLKVPPRCGFEKAGQIITKEGDRHTVFTRELQ